MDNYLIAVQLLTTAAIMIGIYKNKVDSNEKKMSDFKDISERLARLEEKVSFLINQLNKQTT
jgi:hypothetical protein